MKRLVNNHPGRVMRAALGILPFALMVVLYLAASGARLAQNPDDKLLPSFGSFGEAVERMATEPSKRSGDYLLWTDTGASLRRLALGVGISALTGLVFGVLLGSIPYLRANLSPFVATVSMLSLIHI